MSKNRNKVISNLRESTGVSDNTLSQVLVGLKSLDPKDFHELFPEQQFSSMPEQASIKDAVDGGAEGLKPKAEPKK